MSTNPSHDTTATDKRPQVLSSTPAGTTTATAEGGTVTSTDPSTKPDASLAQKLKGDAAGAVHGSLGSVQAAAGTAIRNEAMHEKGLAKMQDEDERLAAKRGVFPVGADKRHVTEDEATAKKE
ncbi:hypothetical protein F4780DRAFT_603697 [Xylariomycetidae sp. FL0641]|nr:hypothetical protein F4780DRAFT_603697 [Xylariomycetidae sp. FL0641]